jgi:type IV secretion system protein TrbC
MLRWSCIPTALAAVSAFLVDAPAAFAAGTGMPWETPINEILNSITGPVAKAIGIMAMVLFGLVFAFSEHGSALRRGLGIAMGVSIAFAASSFGMTFFGFSGGAGF